MSINIDVYTVQHASSVTLTCFVEVNEEYPVYYVYWEHNNAGVITKIDNGTKGMSGSTVETPSLTILFTTPSESGLYVCAATNSIGTGNTSPITLNVIGGKLRII